MINNHKEDTTNKEGVLEIMTKVQKALKPYHATRADAFCATYTSGEVYLDLHTVDKLIQTNDNELLIEVICIMLDYLNDEEK